MTDDCRAPAMALLIGFAVAAAHAADRAPQGVAEGLEKALRISPRPENGRNSEGDFIRLADGRLVLVYSMFISTGHHSLAEIAGRFSSDGGSSWSREDVQVIRRKPGEARLPIAWLYESEKSVQEK